MTLSVSFQPITSGVFGTFGNTMYTTAGGKFGPATAILKNDESGFFDFTTIVPSTSNPSVTPTITAGAYTAGFEVGGLMTFAVGGAGSGVLQSIKVTCKSVQTTALYLNIFDTNPSNSTWTDHAAPAINAADVFSLIGAYPLTSPYSGLGTHTVWTLDGIGASFVGANLYGVLVAVSTPTFASTTGITVKLGIIND